MDDAPGGLMGRGNCDFADLDMGRGASGIEDNISNILRFQRFDSGIDAGGFLFVAMEAGDVKIASDDTGLNIGDANRRIHHIHSQAIADAMNRGFCRAVDGRRRGKREFQPRTQY